MDARKNAFNPNEKVNQQEVESILKMYISNLVFDDDIAEILKFDSNKFSLLHRTLIHLQEARLLHAKTAYSNLLLLIRAEDLFGIELATKRLKSKDLLDQETFLALTGTKEHSNLVAEALGDLLEYTNFKKVNLKLLTDNPIKSKYIAKLIIYLFPHLYFVSNPQQNSKLISHAEHWEHFGIICGALKRAGSLNSSSLDSILKYAEDSEYIAKNLIDLYGESIMPKFSSLIKEIEVRNEKKINLTIYIKANGDGFNISKHEDKQIEKSSVLTTEEARQIHPVLDEMVKANTREGIRNALKNLQQVAKQDTSKVTSHFFRAGQQINKYDDYVIESLNGSSIPFSLIQSNGSELDPNSIKGQAHKISIPATIEFLERSAQIDKENSSHCRIS